MRAKTLALVVLLAVAMISGCRKDAAPAPTAESKSQKTNRSAPAKDVTLRIRKLGGEDGKQVTNRLTVTTPIGDEFSVTEQVGATQLNFRGRIISLPDGRFRVSHEYSENSATGKRSIKGTIEVPPDTETELGGLMAEQGMERVILTVSRT